MTRNVSSPGPIPVPLEVGFDAAPLLGARTGIGHAAAALLDALAERTDLRVTAYAVTWSGRRELGKRLPSGVRAATRPVPARLVRRLWSRTDHPRIERWTGPLDVVHGTNFVAPPGRAAAVVTVHDLTCLQRPDLVTPDARGYPRLIRRALGRGATVHVVSDTVGTQVRESFGLPAERVVRVAPGLMPVPDGDAASGRRIAGGRRYVLALGALEARKNLPALVRAFDAVAGDDADLRLVLAGPDGHDAARVRAAVDAAGARERIAVLGYIDDAARGDLLAGATAFAYPSLDEGFGHPPLEAMHAGVPVVAARAGALPETLGDAALLVDPRDDDALAAALTAAIGDEARRGELVERGRRRAQGYSWRRSAEEMAALYRRVAA